MLIRFILVVGLWVGLQNSLAGGGSFVTLRPDACVSSRRPRLWAVVFRELTWLTDSGSLNGPVLRSRVDCCQLAAVPDEAHRVVAVSGDALVSSG
jgi:hypothetical protein